MKIRQGFLAGAASAGLLVATTFNIGSLEGSSLLRLQLANQATEIREGFEFGLLRPACFRRSSLDASISRRDFNEALGKVFRELGIAIGFDEALFAKAGMFQVGQGRRTLTRADGCEALCRAVIYLADQRMITLDHAPTERFNDYEVPTPYRDAFGYLLGHKIITGYADGSMRAERRLSHRETVYLLFRFFQQVAPGVQTVQRGQAYEVVFLDMPIDPYIFKSIQVVARAGGFTGSPLGTHLQGEQGLKPAQLGSMIRGILIRTGKKYDINTLQSVIAGPSAGGQASRGQLANMLGVLVDLYEPTGPGMAWPYTDLFVNHRAASGLKALGKIGIQLGYPNGRCEADEAVTRFEVIGVLEAVINRLGLDPGTSAPTVAATKPILEVGKINAAPTAAETPGSPDQEAKPASAESPAVAPPPASDRPTGAPDPVPPALSPEPAADRGSPASADTIKPDDDFAQFVAKMKAKQARIRALIEHRRPAAE